MAFSLLRPAVYLVHIFLLVIAELQEPDPSSQAHFKPLLMLPLLTCRQAICQSGREVNSSDEGKGSSREWIVAKL